MKRRIPLTSGGFTIIEVMIVLVIAAVILLIVFLAVPALQRNSRNTQRRADVSRLSAAFLEYIQTSPFPTGNAADNVALSSQIKDEANAATFSTVQISWASGSTTVNSSTIRFKTRSVCNDAGDNVDGNISNGRVALLYLLETSGGYTQHCTQVR